jgi:hypothetical protein
MGGFENRTHEFIRTKALQVFDKVSQTLQVGQGLGIVLLGGFIEEDSLNRQVGVRGIGLPVGVSLDIIANGRNIALCV